MSRPRRRYFCTRSAGEPSLVGFNPRNPSATVSASIERTVSVIKSRLPVALAALLLVSAPALAELKVGVANPIKILNELAETKDVNKSMEGEQAAFKQQAGDREQKLKDLKAQRDQLKPDAPQWADLNKQLVQQQAEA